jgi:hypothetical protein
MCDALEIKYKEYSNSWKLFNNSKLTKKNIKGIESESYGDTEFMQSYLNWKTGHEVEAIGGDDENQTVDSKTSHFNDEQCHSVTWTDRITWTAEVSSFWKW